MDFFCGRSVLDLAVESTNMMVCLATLDVADAAAMSSTVRLFEVGRRKPGHGDSDSDDDDDDGDDVAEEDEEVSLLKMGMIKPPHMLSEDSCGPT
jgi:hypothetical protein